jgi:hypothetical protein
MCAQNETKVLERIKPEELGELATTMANIAAPVKYTSGLR